MSASSHTSNAAPRWSPFGMTLIEVCAVMAANAVLVAVILSALYALGRADRSYATRVDKLRGVAELSTRLRDDLHAAQTLAWDEAAGRLQLTMADDQAVVYTREKDRWERRSTPTADAAAENETNVEPGADELTAAYRVPHQLQATITPAAATAGQQIKLVWRAEHDADRDRPALPTPPELSVTLGRDERILHP
jgi:hypothetical protein